MRIRINQFHLAMATPFRRPYVSWRVVSSIGELRGCTISGTRQHAGQAIAPIPRSSGDGPVEIQRRPISAFSRSISLHLLSRNSKLCKGNKSVQDPKKRLAKKCTRFPGVQGTRERAAAAAREGGETLSSLNLPVSSLMPSATGMSRT